MQAALMQLIILVVHLEYIKSTQLEAPTELITLELIKLQAVRLECALLQLQLEALLLLTRLMFNIAIQVF
jgi:hypothetical protein